MGSCYTRNMLTTPHVLVGLAVIKTMPNLGGLVLAFLSHFLLDFFVSHWNPHLYTEFHKSGRISSSSVKIIIIDGLIAVCLTLFLMYQSLPDLGSALLIGGAAFFAVLPDLIEFPYYFLNYKKNWLKKYVNFEHKHQAASSFCWGMITQVLVSLAALRVLFL